MLRVGMIFLTDPDNPAQLSGMPHRMAAALAEQGVEVIPLLARDPTPTHTLSSRALNRLRGYRNAATPPALARAADRLFSPRVQAGLIRRATAESNRLAPQIERCRPDVLFGVCISTALYALETDIPIVYFSDATSEIVNTTYPRQIARGRIRHAALRHIERVSLARADRAAFASPRVQDSAITTLGLPEHRCSVIPMGAHIVPADPGSVITPAPPPTARDCRLLIVAADPKRKRVDLAVRVAETLRARGIHATLTVIGLGTAAARRSPAADCVGPLRLGKPEHADHHRTLLRASHIQLLPSLGEAFGIAPAESAHFARPSVVSDTGGLPAVVLHDRTGLVLPVENDHNQWADAVGSLVRDPDRYRRYSAAALAYARAELTWSAWATRVIALMRQAVNARSGPASMTANGHDTRGRASA